LRREEREQSAGKIETAVGTPWALVHDLSLGGFTIVCHSDGLEAVRSRESTTKLSRVQSDDKVARNVCFAASTQADIVERPPCARKTFMELKVSRLAFRELLVAAAVGSTVVRGTQSSQGKHHKGQ